MKCCEVPIGQWVNSGSLIGWLIAWVSITGERPWQVFITRDIYGLIMHYHKSFSFWGRIMIIINKSLGLTLSSPHKAFWVINNFCSPLFYGSCLDPLFDVHCTEIFVIMHFSSKLILRWGVEIKRDAGSRYSVELLAAPAPANNWKYSVRFFHAEW